MNYSGNLSIQDLPDSFFAEPGEHEDEPLTNEDGHFPECSLKHEPNGHSCQECADIERDAREDFALRSRSW